MHVKAPYCIGELKGGDKAAVLETVYDSADYISSLSALLRVWTCSRASSVLLRQNTLRVCKKKI
jgi:hypothetical protein